MHIRFHRPTLLPLLVALLAATGQAQEHLRIKGGQRLTGKAISYDDKAEIVTFVTTDGVEHKIKAMDLDQRSAYSLAKSRAPKGDAAAQLRLGNFARDIELYRHAIRHYDAAEKGDPSLKAEVETQRARLRKEAAEYCMRLAQDAIQKNDDKEAEKWLTLLVQKLPNEAPSAEAAELLNRYYEKNHKIQDDHLEQKYAEKLAKELKSGKKAYDTMLEEIRKGLANTRSTSAAKKSFEKAWKEGEHALRELDRVQKKAGPEDTKLAELFDGYRVLIKEHMVDSQLHLASAYTTETAYQRALKSVNLALSIDPKNRKVLDTRARIEAAASDNSILGW